MLLSLALWEGADLGAIHVEGRCVFCSDPASQLAPCWASSLPLLLTYCSALGCWFFRLNSLWINPLALCLLSPFGTPSRMTWEALLSKHPPSTPLPAQVAATQISKPQVGKHTTLILLAVPVSSGFICSRIWHLDAVCEPGSRLLPDTESANDLILVLPASRTVRNKCLLFICHPGYGNVVLAAERTKTDRQSRAFRKLI